MLVSRVGVEASGRYNRKARRAVEVVTAPETDCCSSVKSAEAVVGVGDLVDDVARAAAGAAVAGRERDIALEVVGSVDPPHAIAVPI